MAGINILHPIRTMSFEGMLVDDDGALNKPKQKPVRASRVREVAQKTIEGLNLRLSIQSQTSQ